MPLSATDLPSLTPDQQREHRDACDERNRLIGEARGLIERADAEKRALSADEQEQYDRLTEAAEAARDRQATIERRARLALIEADDAQRSDNRRADTYRQADSRSDDPRFRGASPDELRRLNSFGSFLAGGAEGMSWDQRRDLTVGTGSEGGYLAPTIFVNELIEAIANATPLWGLVRKNEVQPGFAAEIPVRVNRLARFSWTGEKSAGSEDATAPYGMRRFVLHDCGGYIEVTNKLLRAGAINVAADVASEMGQAAAETIEDALMSGTGAGRPLGIFVAHAQGIPTTRDYAGDNTTTAIKGDSLIDAWFGLKEGYQRNANWIFSRTAMSHIQKLKESTGAYIWTGPARDVSAGFSGSIFGRPVQLSEHCPATFTTGLYVGAVGDFMRAYRVFWSGQVEVTRNPYEKQRENMTVFYGRFELDGGPVLAEAVSRIKLG